METKIQRTRLAREIILLVCALLKVANELFEIVSKAVNYRHAPQLRIYVQA